MWRARPHRFHPARRRGDEGLLQAGLGADKDRVRIRGGLVTAVTFVVAGAAVLSPFVAAHAATEGPALTVDLAADRHAINPDVYGMNFADPALETELGLTADRWGGNSTSRYNYQNNTHSTGSDYYYENIVDTASGSLDNVVAGDLSRGVQPVITVPMTGWVAKNSSASHPFACS